MKKEAYQIAQEAIAALKSSVYLLLKNHGKTGLKNVQIGKALGIYMGHVGHEGHISRTILAIMESEGVVRQNKKTKEWYCVDLNEEFSDEKEKTVI